MRWDLRKTIYTTIIFCTVFFGAGLYASADTVSDLQSKINDRNQKIQELEKQIEEYNGQVDDISRQAKTLQSNIRTLDLTQKKLTADLSLTENKITKTGLTIEQLGQQISSAENHIDENKGTISQMFRNSQSLEDISMFELILSGKDITDVWGEVESIQQIRREIKNQSDELRDLRTDLSSKQESLKDQKKQLTTLQQDLSGKKQAAEVTKQEKATLLAQTKNKEQTYRQLLEATEAQKAQFEKEVFEYESQLKLSIDPNAYPAPRHDILSWPLDTVYVTQLFGKTVGAEKLYVSGSHNGVDFRASVGTRVKNVLDGTVVGTGNTDAYPGCYSFGKWVMVRHDNGLSTIYAHLSVISVSTGQQLHTGDLIGYSGNTGYSTGPHLHISVYATQGVRIEKFTTSRGCKQAIIPLADIRAYLDPMMYFPAYNN